VTNLPPALPGTEARILATTDLGANAAPLPTSYGTSGTFAGIVELLDRERERQPTLWLDVGDLVVGNRDGDRVWWNWCRMPAAVSTGAEEPVSVAMVPGVTRHRSLLLDRDFQAEPAGTSARDVLVAAVA
jgi:hypothetical protein